MVDLIIKGKVAGTFQELYPKTLANNVNLNNGKTVQEFANDTVNKYPSNVQLWAGERYPDDTQTVIVSKPLGECFGGWVLRWQRYQDSTVVNQQIQYSYIPKQHASFSGAGTRVMLGKSGGISVSKYFYISGSTITGHASNRESGNEEIVLTGVFEY